MTLSEIHGSSVLIAGYGKEGKSVHTFLHTYAPDLTISIADKYPVTPLYPVAHLHTGKEYLNNLSPYTTVIRSPGIPSFIPELLEYKRNGGHITSAMNLFFSVVTGKTIGVTGTKGKSTTASLIAHIAKQAFADVRLVGNIGIPALEQLENQSPSTLYVIELSSHQLEDIRYSPHIAVLLNIVPEHLDYYHSFEQYVQAKSHITSFQSAGDFLVYNPSHQEPAAIALSSTASKTPISRSDSLNMYAWMKDKNIILERPDNLKSSIDISSMRLVGNQDNILAAVSACALLGVTESQIQESLQTFQPLAHRLEQIGTYRSITFINDSLATIPEATIHALDHLGPTVHTLIAGGYNRGLSYAKLGEYIASLTSLHTLILFPDTGTKIREAITAAQSKLSTPQQHRDIFEVTSMEEAVRIAYDHTNPNTICLLSPASASYNLFKDYADRGEQFKKAVIACQSVNVSKKNN